MASHPCPGLGSAPLEAEKPLGHPLRNRSQQSFPEPVEFFFSSSELAALQSFIPQISLSSSRENPGGESPGDKSVRGRGAGSRVTGTGLSSPGMCPGIPSSPNLCSQNTSQAPGNAQLPLPCHGAAPKAKALPLKPALTQHRAVNPLFSWLKELPVLQPSLIPSPKFSIGCAFISFNALPGFLQDFHLYFPFDTNSSCPFTFSLPVAAPAGSLPIPVPWEGPWNF